MSTETELVPASQKAGPALALFIERRTLVMLALGFSAGLPYFLIFDTLSAWLRASGLSLEVIGFFSLVTLVSLVQIPLGAVHRPRARCPFSPAGLAIAVRGCWCARALIMLGLWLVAGTDPARSLGTIAVFAVLVGFSSATQDIAIDAWRIEAAEISKQGAMAAAYQWGYRVAMIVAGAVPLLLAEAYGWNFSYAVMAALMTIGILAVLAAPREERHVIRPIHAEGIRPAPAREALEWVVRLAILAAGALVAGLGSRGQCRRARARARRRRARPARASAVLSAWASDARVWVHLAAVVAGFGVIVLAALPLPGVRTRPGVYLSSALADPLRDFFARYRAAAGLILALICLYRIPDFVLNIMNPFYLDLGFTPGRDRRGPEDFRRRHDDARRLCRRVGGGALRAHARDGDRRVRGAVEQSALHLARHCRATVCFALFVAIGLDNVAGGFAGTCLIAYMSSLTSAGFTATQYALFSSLYAIPGRIDRVAVGTHRRGCRARLPMRAARSRV